MSEIKWKKVGEIYITGYELKQEVTEISKPGDIWATYEAGKKTYVLYEEKDKPIKGKVILYEEEGK